MYDPSTGYMCFAEALAYLKRTPSCAVARGPWKNRFVLYRSTEPSYGLVLHMPGVFTLTNWALSSQDVLAEDWVPALNADTPQSNGAPL